MRKRRFTPRPRRALAPPPTRAASRRFAAFCAVALAASACTEKRGAGDPSGTSPQATAVPAPFAILPAPTREAALWGDAGIVAVPARGDLPVPSDVLPHEMTGATLTAQFRVPDALAHKGDDPLSRRAETRMTIELSEQRMRIVHRGSGFPLPEGAELRARADRYGHVLFLDGISEYRVLPAGSLRALYTDRRRDVAPLGAATVNGVAGTASRIGHSVRRATVETRTGSTTFEIARIPDMGDRGTLLARYLLDLICAAPQTALLGTDEIPLRAEFHWRESGTLVFEVLQLGKKTDLTPSAMSVVPPASRFTPTPIPAADLEPLLLQKELAQVRGVAGEPPAASAGPTDLRNDLLVRNTFSVAHLVVVEGFPVAWIRPHAQGIVSGLPRGRYQAQLRTFLGDHITAPVTVQVPGTLGLTAPDAGDPN